LCNISFCSRISIIIKGSTLAREHAKAFSKLKKFEDTFIEDSQELVARLPNSDGKEYFCSYFSVIKDEFYQRFPFRKDQKVEMSNLGKA
jgi:hypothetical protein